MIDQPRETQVMAAVVSLVDSLLNDFDVIELLTDLTERCVELLDVATAGLLLADPRRYLHLMAATSEQTRDLELFQLQADDGPCLDCYASGQRVSVPDLQVVPQRWPSFVAAATDAGFVSVHAVPMRAAGTVLGTLGLFGTHTGDLNDADLLVGQTLAHIASVAILQHDAPRLADLNLHLRSALINRVVVEQAKGFLYERLGVSLENAFTLLRRYAHLYGIHMSEVARNLMTQPASRPAILEAMTQLLPSPS